MWRPGDDSQRPARTVGGEFPSSRHSTDHDRDLVIGAWVGSGDDDAARRQHRGSRCVLLDRSGMARNAAHDEAIPRQR